MEIIMERSFLPANFSFGNSDRTLPRLRTIGGLLALMGITGFLMAAGDQADVKDKRNGQEGVRDRDKFNENSGDVVIPESVQKLNLSESQKSQINDICRDYDQSMKSVWQQFHDRYMRTIRLETSMLSAIEDQLSDKQRQTIREHRRKTARYERVTTRVTEKPNLNDRPKAETSSTQVNEKSTQEKEKAVGEVDVDVGNIGVSLTRDQENVADKIHQKYRPHLRSMNREIHHLHNRLLSLETEKMAEIEHVLTKDQMNKLKSDRENISETAKVTLSREEATKTE